MSGLAIGRGKVIGITAAAAVVLTTMSSGGAAQAVHQDPSQVGVAAKAAAKMGAFRSRAAAEEDPILSACTIKGYAPNKVVIGAAPVTKTFSLKVTGCELGEWILFAGPFVAGNFSDPDLSLTPKVTVSPQWLLNSDAGKALDGAGALAWGAGEDPAVVEPAISEEFPFTLQRQAKFGTFNASPEPVKKGKKITLKGTLSRINWNGAQKLKFAGFAGKAQVQFKANGTSKYVTVKTVTSTKAGKVSTTVKATKTGRWRLFFPGISTTSPATSGSDAVKVNS